MVKSTGCSWDVGGPQSKACRVSGAGGWSQQEVLGTEHLRQAGDKESSAAGNGEGAAGSLRDPTAGLWPDLWPLFSPFDTASVIQQRGMLSWHSAPDTPPSCSPAHS